MEEKYNQRGFITITPAKNEEISLPFLIQSMVNQTVKPLLWVIIDDGSTDSSPEIIKEAGEKYGWIQSIRLAENNRDIGKHYAYVCRHGFDFSSEYCKKNSAPYEYIGLIDADMILETEFFDRLIREFEKNPRLGLASGGIYYKHNNNLIYEKGREDLPRGGARLWRRKCFEETGGFLLTRSPDSVSNVKAKIRGWETKQFKDIIAIQTRKTSSAEGLWQGYWAKGVNAYFLNMNPIFALLNAIKYLFEWPHYIGLAYFCGYYGSVLRKAEQIDDEEIRNYYENKLKDVKDKKLTGGNI